MAVLYPPYLEGTIPAQVGDTLCIPYQLNRAQGIEDLQNANVFVRIKTINTNKLLLDINEPFLYTQDQILTVSIKDKCQLIVGQYYKVQIGFGADDVAVYFSTPSVFKYTVGPSLQLKGLEENAINCGRLYFEAAVNYDKGADPTELVSEFVFNVYCNNELYYTTGSQFANNNTIAAKVPKFYKDLNSVYEVQCIATTVNNLVIKTPRYTIKNDNQNFSDTEPVLTYSYLQESAKVIISTESALNGKYELVRGVGETPLEYEIISELDLILDGNATILYQDYTVLQGVYYQYGIRQVDDLSCSKIIYTESIYIDYEHIYLYDGTVQLKIEFNPKVSSLKMTIPEQKTDTLGGQYPIFFRNGRVKYKELPISGLISMHMDKNGDFQIDKLNVDLVRTETPSEYKDINTIAGEVFDERVFREKVWAWLCNGEPKLFRSPTEGMAVVYIMNVSLSPNDTLGRRLYTFSATAYEMADCSVDTFQRFGFIQHSQIHNGNCDIVTNNISLQQNNKYLFADVVQASVHAPIGTKCTITYVNNVIPIIIGRTGTYNIYIDQNNIPVSIMCSEDVEIETVSKYRGSLLSLESSKFPKCVLRQLEPKETVTGQQLLDVQLEVVTESTGTCMLKTADGAETSIQINSTMQLNAEALKQYTTIELDENLTAIVYYIALEEQK